MYNFVCKVVNRYIMLFYALPLLLLISQLLILFSLVAWEFLDSLASESVALYLGRSGAACCSACLVKIVEHHIARKLLNA